MLGRFVQIARAGVVAESGPILHHFRLGSFRQILKRREIFKKALKIGNDRRGGGLLQHGFGNPNAVGIAVQTPRQLAFIGAKPFDKIGVCSVDFHGLQFHPMLWWISTLLLVNSWGASPNAKSNAKAKTTCNAKEIQRQDCRLTVDTYNLRLLKDTVAWSDGTWHTVDDLPLKGDGTEWEKIRFEFLNGWPILQLWIWDAGAGENKVQSLNWYVADAEQRKFTVVATGVVRKRRPHKDAKKFSYDAMEPHALKPLKDGTLEWTLKQEKKIIGRVAHGV